MEKLIKAVQPLMATHGIALSDEYYYQSLPLCVIDAVFSIGVRYEGVRKVTQRFAKHAGIRRIRADRGTVPSISEQLSVSEYRRRYGTQNASVLADEVFQNRQRTSTQNGILKAEAVGRFMQVLAKYKVDYFQDLVRIWDDSRFEEEIKEIPGQRSGISLQYFFMLAGNGDLIKPDRMIMRFLERVFPGKSFDVKQATEILQTTSRLLQVDHGLKVSPRELDHLIWRVERERGR